MIYYSFYITGVCLAFGLMIGMDEPEDKTPSWAWALVFLSWITVGMILGYSIKEIGKKIK